MVSRIKPHHSEKWLKYQYQTLNKTAAQIGRELGITEQAVYVKLKEFNLIRNARKIQR